MDSEMEAGGGTRGPGLSVGMAGSVDRGTEEQPSWSGGAGVTGGIVFEVSHLVPWKLL